MIVADFRFLSSQKLINIKKNITFLCEMERFSYKRLVKKAKNSRFELLF